MAKAPSLIDEVLAAVEAAKPRRENWYQRLPEDAQAELAGLRAAFDPAQHIKTHFARALIASAARRGWPMPGLKQVTLWLDAR